MIATPGRLLAVALAVTTVASHAADTAPAREPDLATTIARSQNYLLGSQKPDGFWVGELFVDSTLVSDTLAYHYWNGKIDPEWQRKAVNHLFSKQLPDGGWNIYHGGPSEVNATIKAYLALKLAGVPVTDPRMLKAREEGRKRVLLFNLSGHGLLDLSAYETYQTGKMQDV